MRRMIDILCLFMTGTLFMISCDNHETPIDLSLKIGNIYCANGVIVPPAFYESDMNGIGVIVAIGKDDDKYKAIAVARKDIGYYAYCDTTMDLGTSGDIDVINGKESTAILISKCLQEKENEYDVPAAFAANAYDDNGVTGWHLPSVAEIRTMINNAPKVKKSLELIGGDWLDDKWYQSSNQDGTNEETAILYNLNVSTSGKIRSRDKSDDGPVRPFVMIK